MRVGHQVAARYRLDAALDSGGMGVVWRATDLELGRVVAVKQARPDQDDPDGRRLRREARIAAGVQNRHVVTVHDVVEDDGHWLIMEYLDAPTLAELVRMRPGLSAGTVARIGAQLADGLAAVHAAGIVHGDLKPANVMVTGDGTVKLTDFGVSHVVWGELTLTDGDLISGTPRYLAPEIADGRRPTPAADVFSLAATLLAALTPDPGDTPPPWRRAQAGALDLPEQAGALGTALSAMFALSPQDRPCAVEARDQLHAAAAPGAGSTRPAVVAAAGGGGSAATGGGSANGSKRRRRGRRPWLVAAAALTVIAIGGGLVVLYQRGWSLSGAQPSPAQVASTASQEPATSSSAAVATPRPIIGDQHTADPCSLANPAPLARFGQVDVATDYGNFDRCDLLVSSNDKNIADVQVQLANASDQPSGPVAEQDGAVGVVRAPGSSTNCERVLLLADHNQVVITAKQVDNSTADFCAMAESTVGYAIPVLNKGPIPRRAAAPDPHSMISLDTCSMLNAPALERVPGIDAVHPDSGFGGWTCRWHSTTGADGVVLRFDRNNPLNAEDGHPVKLAGRQAFVQPDGDGDHTCLAQVVHRQYTDEHGEKTVELIWLRVSGDRPSNQLCTTATELARSAAGTLPPP